jgi:hypothetical protein
MSEKIIIRNKLVSKLESKMDDLTKSIQLLTKIDKKLFLKQSGGTYGLQQMGVNLAYLQSRANMMKSVNSNNDVLKKQLAILKSTVENYNNIITDISNNLVSDVVSMNDIDTKFNGLTEELRELIYQTLSLPFDKKTYEISDWLNYINEKADEIIIAIKAEVSEPTDNAPLLALFTELFNKNIKEGQKMFNILTRAPSGSFTPSRSRSDSPTRQRSSSGSSQTRLPDKPEEGSQLEKHIKELNELNGILGSDPRKRAELEGQIKIITERREQYDALVANKSRTDEENTKLNRLYNDLVKYYKK